RLLPDVHRSRPAWQRGDTAARSTRRACLPRASEYREATRTRLDAQDLAARLDLRAGTDKRKGDSAGIVQACMRRTLVIALLCLVACHRRHDPTSIGELFAGTNAPNLTGPVLAGLDWNEPFDKAHESVTTHNTDVMTYF